MTELSLPPLFTASSSDGDSPFDMACERAQTGCDAGLVTYDLRPDVLGAALVFAPEVTLTEAMIMLPLCGVGFQNALGALAPPEVSVHLDWSGKIRLNGGVAGRLKIAASPPEPATVPDWLVVGLELALWPASDETGHTPDVTALFSEGCSEVDAPALLEAWVRHSLVWINRWQEEGPRPLHKEWHGIAHGIDDIITQNGQKGTFIDVDENFGMILRSDNETTIIPLTEILTEFP